MKSIFLALLVTGAVWAQTPTHYTWTRDMVPKRDVGNIVWIASIVTMSAASAADAKTSYGLYEMNPVLRSGDGRFGTKGIGIKVGITGAVIVVEVLTRKRMRKAWTMGNFMLGGVYGASAWRNEGLR